MLSEKESDFVDLELAGAVSSDHRRYDEEEVILELFQLGPLVVGQGLTDDPFGELSRERADLRTQRRQGSNAFSLNLRVRVCHQPIGL